jgi:hypothetical protein
MSYVNDDLIRAYKETRNIISNNAPEDKERIINEYIDLVKKINANAEKQQQGSYGYNHNTEFSKMLKNPLEISIYNNFQRYNDEPQNNINPILNKNIESISKTPEESINELVGVSTYVRNN